MHVRSGHFIKSGQQSVRELASHILSEESVTKRVGLETIVEDTSCQQQVNQLWHPKDHIPRNR